MNADLLLLLAQDQPLQVPNKLYEYLGVRTPIFAFADADGEVAEMLRQAGGHYVVTENQTESEAEAALQQALERADADGGSDTTLLSEWSTHSQLSALVQRLGG